MTARTDTRTRLEDFVTAVVERPDSAARRTRGTTVWLTGLPSAGKTTLATALAAALTSGGTGERVEVLDGDEVRTFLSKGLGLSKADRDTNVLRIGWVAATLAKHGVLVIASVISPYAQTRAAVRALHTDKDADFLEIHVAAPVQVCSARDVKGLYAQQRAGKITGMTGVDAPYEIPTAPEVVVPTHEQSLEESVQQLLDALKVRGIG